MNAKVVPEVMSQAWNGLQVFSCKLYTSLKDHEDVCLMKGVMAPCYKQQRQKSHRLLPVITIGNQVFRLSDNCHSSISVAVSLHYVIMVARAGQLFKSMKMKINIM